MSNYLRYYSGTMYFFTLVAFERRNIFCKPDFLSAFKTSIQEVRKQYPFKIIAWVQLPDHLHCILNFEQENHDFSKIWSIIKRKTTKLCPQYHLRDDDLSLSKVLRNEKGIFQRRFYEHLIRNEQDLYNHLNYMHFNPVKHNLVEKTKDWQYSTFHRYVKNGFYDENWGENMDLPHIEDWE